MEYKDGYIRGLDGRPIQVDSEHKVLVYTLQSDEAIQMSAAYCVFHKWLLREGYKWREDFGIVLWMHDEWQVECRSAIAPRVAELGNEAIAWAGRYFNIDCPHEGVQRLENTGASLTEIEEIFRRLSDVETQLTRSIHELREVTSKTLYMMLKERDNETH